MDARYSLQFQCGRPDDEPVKCISVVYDGLVGSGLALTELVILDRGGQRCAISVALPFSYPTHLPCLCFFLYLIVLPYPHLFPMS